MRLNTFVMALFLGMGAASAAVAQSTDQDGCWWSQTANCLRETNYGWSGTELWVRFQNSCSLGIYVKVCYERDGRSDHCGASHISPGRQETFWGGYNNTGSYSTNWIGSARASSDWVCAGKTNNW